MEKIQKALDKAREARAAGALLAQRAEAEAAPVALAGAKQASEKFRKALDKGRGERAAATSAGQARAAAEPGDAALRISYRQTRVAPASPDVLKRNRVVAASADTPAADAFRILRTQVLARLDARQGRSVAICAAGKGSGKSLVAVNLAVSVASQLNRSAVLVDLDLRSPSVHRCFGLRPECGISDYLLGRKRLDECLINPGIERLVLLPQSTELKHSLELLTSPRMAALAQELKGRYPDRVVIYDCAPLLLAGDPLLVIDYADGCLLVIREGKTSKAEFVRAAELVGEHRYLGTVLNNGRWSASPIYYK